MPSTRAEPVSPEVLEQAIALLARDDLDDQGVASGMRGIAGDPMVARRLIDWIPEAFGYVLLAHVEGLDLNLAESFSARASNDRWYRIPLDKEPIFVTALVQATRMFHDGPRDRFSAVASRSSQLAAVNNARAADADLKGATLSGPALIGIPAEIYLSWVARLRGWLGATTVR